MSLVQTVSLAMQLLDQLNSKVDVLGLLLAAGDAGLQEPNASPVGASFRAVQLIAAED